MVIVGGLCFMPEASRSRVVVCELTITPPGGVTSSGAVICGCARASQCRHAEVSWFAASLCPRIVFQVDAWRVWFSPARMTFVLAKKVCCSALYD